MKTFEQLLPGDFVYCFDYDNKQIVEKKVLSVKINQNNVEIDIYDSCPSFTRNQRYGTKTATCLEALKLLLEDNIKIVEKKIASQKTEE